MKTLLRLLFALGVLCSLPGCASATTIPNLVPIDSDGTQVLDMNASCAGGICVTQAYNSKEGFVATIVLHCKDEVYAYYTSKGDAGGNKKFVPNSLFGKICEEGGKTE